MNKMNLKWVIGFTILLISFTGCTKEKDTLKDKAPTSQGQTIGNQNPEQITWAEALKGIHVWNIEVGSTFNPDYTKSTHAYLCPNGYFYMSVVDHITGSEFEGVWTVEDGPVSQPSTIKVQFTDGDMVYYQITFTQNKLYIEQAHFQFEYNSENC